MKFDRVVSEIQARSEDHGLDALSRHHIEQVLRFLGDTLLCNSEPGVWEDVTHLLVHRARERVQRKGTYKKRN